MNIKLRLLRHSHIKNAPNIELLVAFSFQTYKSKVKFDMGTPSY